MYKYLGDHIDRSHTCILLAKFVRMDEKPDGKNVHNQAQGTRVAGAAWLHVVGVDIYLSPLNL